MEFTEEHQKALIQVVRDQQSKILRDERSLYFGDVSQLSKVKNLQFINKSIIIPYKGSDNLCLGEINKEHQKAKELLESHDIDLKVVFDVEEVDQDNCIYCGWDENIPIVTIQFTRYNFKSLDQVKSSIESRIKWILNDAAFKFKHQENGKDVKRYLKLIDEYLN